MSKDKIEIHNLECFGYHGVLEEEKTLGQKFIVSCSIYTDIKTPGKTDDIEDSVNYASIAEYITKWMSNARYNLIESVAEKKKKNILLKFPTIDSIELTVKKPWAPIHFPVDTVSVTVENAWETVFIGVGSNLGDKQQNIEDALEKILGNKYCKDVYISDIIKSEPYGYKEQDEFLNGVISMKTLYSPTELLEFLHEVEESGHRTREIHWGPRTIDLDILFYGDKVIQTKDLVIPHKDMIRRDFVLGPLNTIAPFFIHPVYNKTIEELYENLKRNSN